MQWGRNPRMPRLARLSAIPDVPGTNASGMDSRRLIFRHAILSLSFVGIYLCLNRPEVILISHLGTTAWYPATGLVLGLMLGVSPWYVLLTALADALAGALIYHQPLGSASETMVRSASPSVTRLLRTFCADRSEST